MRRRAALILLAVLGVLTGSGAFAQLPDAARNNASRSMIPDGAARGGGAGPGGSGAGSRGPSSSFSAFPDPEPRQGGGAAPGGAALPGSFLPRATTTPPGVPGRPASPAEPARPVPLIGAGNFCAQPAGLCGPACSVTCPPGRTAFCSSGQGGSNSPASSTDPTSPTGPTSPIGGSLCTGAPKCSCR